MRGGRGHSEAGTPQPGEGRDGDTDLESSHS